MISYDGSNNDKPFLIQLGTLTIRVSLNGLCRITQETRQALDEHYIRSLTDIMANIPKPKPPRKPTVRKTAVWDKTGNCRQCGCWHDHTAICPFTTIPWGVPK